MAAARIAEERRRRRRRAATAAARRATARERSAGRARRARVTRAPRSLTRVTVQRPSWACSSVIEAGATSIRQNASGGASSAATTAALTTPAWVIAIAVRVARAPASASQSRTRASSAVRTLAAVRRGVRVGHPRAHACLVRRRRARAATGPAQRPKSHSPGAAPRRGQPGQRRPSRAPAAPRSPAPRPRAAAARRELRRRGAPARVERLVGAEGSGSHRVGRRVAHEQQPARHREPVGSGDRCGAVGQGNLLGMTRPVGLSREGRISWLRDQTSR